MIGPHAGTIAGFTHYRSLTSCFCYRFCCNTFPRLWDMFMDITSLKSILIAYSSRSAPCCNKWGRMPYFVGNFYECTNCTFNRFSWENSAWGSWNLLSMKIFIDPRGTSKLFFEKNIGNRIMEAISSNSS